MAVYRVSSGRNPYFSDDYKVQSRIVTSMSRDDEAKPALLKQNVVRQSAFIEDMPRKEVATARPVKKPVDVPVDWLSMELPKPPKKKPVAIRLDDEVVAFFKKYGRGYQTRMNLVLKKFVEFQSQQMAAA